ncbi:hypothetical protein [Levilactobacillus andaensis]|uniref:hypothetical protein n=1 Tax=Levilactobacillus andaensis TaxID=2799570 RepID=UPI0019414BD1|nr:hypothetical protein [Levilactobacillus andaensis]
MDNLMLAQVRDIFPLLAVNFELLQVGESTPDDSTGGFSAPDDDATDLTPIKQICEPLIPESKAQSMQMGAGGGFTNYVYQWFSLTDYPKGTLVLYAGIVLEVVEREPYWEQGGFAIYYLQNRSDHSDL